MARIFKTGYPMSMRDQANIPLLGQAAPRIARLAVRVREQCISVRWIIVLGGLVLLTACSEPPKRPAFAPQPVAKATVLVSKDALSIGQRAAELAEKELGVPYRYGGASPSGFDCSGLVFYVYHALGVNVPRTALLQHEAAKSVAKKDLRPGDLVFFYTSVDHVGIYVGNNEFVHAPSTGKTVTRASLKEPYFALGFAGGGRLVDTGGH